MRHYHTTFSHLGNLAPRSLHPWLENMNCIELAQDNLEISWLISFCILNGFMFELSVGSLVLISMSVMPVHLHDWVLHLSKSCTRPDQSVHVGSITLIFLLSLH